MMCGILQNIMRWIKLNEMLKKHLEGKVTRDEYVGFLKGKIMECVLECDEDDTEFRDLTNAMMYIKEYYYVIGAEKVGIGIDEYRELSILNKALGK